MKNFRNSIALAAVTALICQAAVNNVVAKVQPAPVQIYICIIIIDVAVYSVAANDGGEPDIRTSRGGSGEAHFSSAADAPELNTLDASLTPSALSATFSDDVYGEITTTVDLDRTAAYTDESGVGTSVVTSDEAAKAGERFPAVGTIRFHGRITISSKPDVTYLSRTPFELANNNLQSFGPFNKETFTLQTDVEFYDKDDPRQATAFTVYAGDSKVTLQ